MDDALPGLALDALRDIHGIAAVPWWPWAPGWWLLLAAAVLLGLAARYGRLLARLRLPFPGLRRGGWRRDAAAALRDLRRRARAGQEARAVLSELSELLRRIAMARLGRPACAGLTGVDWLAWLAAHDPRGFPWMERGQSLLTAPYAPPGPVAERDLLPLIDAAAAWVAGPRPGRRAVGVGDSTPGAARV